jgi:hypothetical protein
MNNMRNTVKLVIVLITAFSINIADIAAQQRQNAGSYPTESECLGVELDGSVTLKAWGSGRNRFDAVTQAKKNAVRDVLFRGISKGTDECNSRALIPEVNAETKYEDYFFKFFAYKNGAYKGFISARDERIDHTIFRTLNGADKTVTYSVVVRVLRSELRQQLIADGILPK